MKKKLFVILAFALVALVACQPAQKKIEKKEGEIPEFALDPQMMQKSMLYVFPVMI